MALAKMPMQFWMSAKHSTCASLKNQLMPWVSLFSSEVEVTHFICHLVLYLNQRRMTYDLVTLTNLVEAAGNINKIWLGLTWDIIVTLTAVNMLKLTWYYLLSFCFMWNTLSWCDSLHELVMCGQSAFIGCGSGGYSSQTENSYKHAQVSLYSNNNPLF